ncbi:histidyl-tRNA synthetase [Actinocrispum wychmicini]|uniref:Histidine--tRNA ligase n=2 Tax=Actinocrispum wychmicini TaxID=1213861 RepID=A0A4R2J2C3_9PSEU|nr:histidyl-tRNA synthetase [Actinocrispum wychmicini]
MKMDLSPARGTRDLLPATVAVRDHVLARITEVYHRYGYQRIETPALENIERLTGGQGGENEKLIFKILRRGLAEIPENLDDLVDLGLRFDLTVPLTRFYGNNHAQLPVPFRSFQFGPVWRAERPQKGRYRQFVQCDIDLIGEESVLAEIELIEATTEALAAAGLPGVTVRLSDRRFLSALAESAGVAPEAQGGFFITLDKLDKIGWDGVRKELLGRGFTEDQVDGVQQAISTAQGLDPAKLADQLTDALPALPEDVAADLAATTGALAAIGDLAWEFDPTLVRGMGYYTGQIFELSHPGSASSVAGGGRYDQLIGRSLGKDVPACGFSIGFERIVDLLDNAPKNDALAVLHESDVPTAEVLAVARELRAGGRQVTTIRRRGKFGAQLGRLQEWGYTSFVHVKPGDITEVRPLAVRETS